MFPRDFNKSLFNCWLGGVPLVRRIRRKCIKTFLLPLLNLQNIYILIFKDSMKTVVCAEVCWEIWAFLLHFSSSSFMFIQFLIDSCITIFYRTYMYCMIYFDLNTCRPMFLIALSFSWSLRMFKCDLRGLLYDILDLHMYNKIYLVYWKVSRVVRTCKQSLCVFIQ